MLRFSVTSSFQKVLIFNKQVGISINNRKKLLLQIETIYTTQLLKPHNNVSLQGGKINLLD